VRPVSSVDSLRPQPQHCLRRQQGTCPASNQGVQGNAHLSCKACGNKTRTQERCSVEGLGRNSLCMHGSHWGHHGFWQRQARALLVTVRPASQRRLGCVGASGRYEAGDGIGRAQIERMQADGVWPGRVMACSADGGARRRAPTTKRWCAAVQRCSGAALTRVAAGAKSKSHRDWGSLGVSS
jgi:hypothetical protein